MCDYRTMNLPSSQAELIRLARGARSQAEFARLLGVDRSCLSRYEREILGAPPSVITACLRAVVQQLHAVVPQPINLSDALLSAREVVSALERATGVGRSQRVTDHHRAPRRLPPQTEEES